MSADKPDGDDLLLARLRQSASGDAAVRQLRRRYDLLRRDYEHLVDRLGELEDRLAEREERPVADTPAPTPRPEPQEESAPSAVKEGLVAPLLRLRDEYLEAVTDLQSIVSGLDGLAAAAFKGQRVAPAPGGGYEPAEGPPIERPALRPRRMQVDVKGGGFGDLLDFQERLSGLPGVARVSINAIDNERATLIVELETPFEAS